MRTFTATVYREVSEWALIQIETDIEGEPTAGDIDELERQAIQLAMTLEDDEWTLGGGGIPCYDIGTVTEL